MSDTIERIRDVYCRAFLSRDAAESVARADADIAAVLAETESHWKETVLRPMFQRCAERWRASGHKTIPAAFLEMAVYLDAKPQEDAPPLRQTRYNFEQER